MYGNQPNAVWCVDDAGYRLPIKEGIRVHVYPVFSSSGCVIARRVDKSDDPNEEWVIGGDILTIENPDQLVPMWPYLMNEIRMLGSFWVKGVEYPIQIDVMCGTPFIVVKHNGHDVYLWFAPGWDLYAADEPDDGFLRLDIGMDGGSAGDRDCTIEGPKWTFNVVKDIVLVKAVMEWVIENIDTVIAWDHVKSSLINVEAILTNNRTVLVPEKELR